jgi:hypothetical protein
MSNFWKSLNRVANDQLSTLGYLPSATESRIGTKKQLTDSRECASRERKRKTPWPRLATLR